MSILSGFKKYKDYILTSSGYQLSSRWTKSDAVVMGDGTDDTNTLEKNLGSIQGITDSLTATSSNVALSAKGASDMYNELNSNLENCFIISSEYSDTVPSGTTNYYEPILTASIPDGYKLFAITGLRASISSIFFYSNERRLTYNQIQIGFRSVDTSDLSGVLYSYRFIFVKENMISIH